MPERFTVTKTDGSEDKQLEDPTLGKLLPEEHGK